MSPLTQVTDSEQLTIDIKLLFSCHTTNLGHFKNILLSEDTLNPTSTFPPKDISGDKENVLYCFYGLPFYVSKEDKDFIDTVLTTDMPVAIILNTDIINRYSHFFPFDTGAAYKDRINIFKTNKDNITNYKVDLSNNAELRVKKFIKRFFDSNGNYCYSTPQKLICKNGNDIEERLTYMYRSNFDNNNLLDERVFAVELHSTNSIELNNNTIRAIVIPEELYTDEIKNLIDAKFNEVEILRYEGFGRKGPDTFRDLMKQKVMEVYRKMELL